MSELIEILTQIKQLEKRASRLKKSGATGVIKAIKKQIAEYGLTASDLGFHSVEGSKSASAKGRVPSGIAHSRTKVKNDRAPVPVKYRDSAGNTWTGRGKMPVWLRKELASGVALESFLVNIG